MPDKRILIFDLDGTLIDTMTQLADLFCEMLQREHGVADAVSRSIYVELAGKGPRPQFEAVLATIGHQDQELLDDITERYWQVAEAFQPVAFPETLEVLEQLHRDGHTLAVSSGGTTASVERKTRLTGLDHLFSLALGTDEGVPNMRKGPGHFELLTRALDLAEGDLQARGVFVGDAVFDMQVARDARIVAVGRISDGNGEVLRRAGAQHLIQDLREMHALLTAL
jgi:phosphoglycolate phosphatase-like HAD superfamily hydrolase